MVFEYRIDGGPWVQFGYVCGTGAGAATASALSGGTLEIRINAANKESGETYWFDNVTVTGAPGPVMNPVADITVCPSPPNVTVSFSGGQPGTVYQWVNSNTATGIAASGSTNNNLVFTAANVTSQQVSTITVTPRLGACPGTPQTFNVTVNPRPVATNPGPRTFCAGDPIDIPITGTPPTSNYNWTVSNTNTGLPASGSGNVMGTANTVTTTQTATVVITPSDNGCNGPTANFTVTVSPRPTMNPVADVVRCAGQLISVNFSGMGGGIVYNWTNDNPSIGVMASGTGPINTPAAVVSTQQVANITVTPRIGNCTGTPVMFTITVNPVPTVQDPPDRTLCGGNLVQVNFAGSSTTATYNWTNSNTTIGIGASGTGNLNFVASTVTANQTATFTVRATENGCQGPPQTFTVTVTPGPTVNPLPDLIYCGNQMAGISIGGSPNTTFNWTNNNTAIGLGATGMGNINFTTTDVTALTTGTIIVTPTNASCSGKKDTFLITVTPIPTLPAPSPVSLCEGDPISLAFSPSPANATVNWTNSNTAVGLAGSGTGNLTGTAATSAGAVTTANITVMPTVGVCSGVPQNFVLTVTPAPAVNPISNVQACAGATINVGLNSTPTGATFNWLNNNTAIGLGATGSGPISFTAANVTTPQTATISTIATLNGCSGPVRAFDITVNPAPILTDPLDENICGGAPLAVGFAVNPPNATINWTNTNPAIGLPANGTGDIATSAASVATTQTATITATPSLGTCPGTPQSFTVTVTPFPVLNPIPLTIAQCSGDNVNIVFGSTPGGAVFNWTNDNTATGLPASGTGNLVFTAPVVSSPQVSNIRVTPVIGGCTGQPQIFALTINPIPTLNPPAPVNVCGGAPINVVFSGTATTYTWTNNNPAIGVAANGTGSIAATAANTSGTATITVTPQGICAGPAQTFPITVTATPSVNAVSNVQACIGQTLNVNFAGTGGGVFNWTNNNTAIGLGASGTGNIPNFTANAPNNTTATGTVTVTPVNGTCTGTPQTFNIAVAPLSTVVDPADLSACGNAPVVVTFTGNAPSYTWTNNNTTIGLPATGTGNINFTAANITGTATITVTPGGACPGPAQTFDISISPGFFVNDPPNVSACSGNNVAVTFTGNAPAYTWTNNNPAIGLPANGTGDISFTAAATPGTATITVTPQGGCPGATQTFDIAVSNVFAVDDPADLNSCGNAPVAVVFTGNAPAYTWTNNNTAIGLAASGTGNLNFTATNTTATATITVTPGGACPGPAQTFTVNLTAVPTLDAVANQNACTGQAVSIALNATPGTTINWTNSNPNIGLAASGSGNTLAFTATTPTNTTEIGTITATPSNGTCAGTPQTFLFTATPGFFVNPPAGVTRCGGGNIAVAFTGNAPAYTWTNDNPAIGLPASGTGDISFTAPNATGTATITVTPTGGCPGGAQTFTISIAATPSVDAVANQSFCAGQNADIPLNASAGAVLSWTNSNPAIGLGANGTGAIPAFTATAVGAAQTATLTVTPELNGCTGTPVSFDVAVQPSDTVAVVPNVAVCGGDPVAVAFVGNAATYTWTNSNPAIGLPANGTGNLNFTAAATSGTANITVSPGTGICAGPSRTFTVTIASGADVNPVASQTVCAGQPVSVNFTGTSGAIFDWTNSNPAIGLAASGSGNISFTPNTAQTATITVTPKAGSCTGTARTFDITVNPVPTVNPTADQTVCSGQTLTNVTFSGTGNPVFNWTNNNPQIGLAASGNGAIVFPSSNTTVPIVAQFTVTPAANGCTGVSDTFEVRINPVPTLNPVADVAACAGQPVNVAFSGSGNAPTYTWTNDNPTIGLPASGSGDLSFTAAAAPAALNATVTVTPLDASGCVGPVQTFAVSVSPLPSMTPAQDLAPCPNTPVTVTFIGTVGATFAWTNSNTAIGLPASGTGNRLNFTALNPGATPIPATIVVTPAVGSCKGVPDTFQINIGPTPGVDSIPDVTLCSGQNSGIAFSGQGNPQFIWTNNNPAVGIDLSGTGNIVFTAPNVTTNETALIRVTPRLNGCDGAPRTFQVNILTLPSVAPVPDRSVCTGDTVALQFTGSPNTTFTWTNDNPSIGLPANGTGNVGGTVSAPNTVQTARFTVTPSIPGCSGNPLSFTITANPKPVAAISGNLRVCLGDTTVLSATGGTGFKWNTGQTLSSIQIVPTFNLTYVVTVTSAANCTATATASVQVNFPNGTTRLAGTCDPAQVGVRTFNFQNQAGCDSTVTLITTLLRRDTVRVAQTSCDSALVGVFPTTFTNSVGCDSVLILTISLDRSQLDTTRLQLAACDPRQVGTVQNIFRGTDGCDSIVIATTRLLRSDTVRVTRQTCNPNQVGETRLTFRNTVGCDSIVITNTLFDPSARDTTRLALQTCNPAQMGTTERLEKGADGCDSLIITVTTLLRRDTTLLSVRTCDPSLVGTSTSRILPNAVGCDSLVVTSFVLDNNLCAFLPTAVATPTRCADSKDGTVRLSLLAGNLPSTYSWRSADGTTGTGQFAALNTPVVLNSLPPGAFSVTITKGGTNTDTVFNLNILAPPAVTVQASATLQAPPFALRCAGDANGVATATASGGNGTFSYRWSDGNTGTTLRNLGAGTYTVTISDNNGCTATAAATVNAPPPIGLKVTVSTPVCGGTEAEVAFAGSGGATPYTVSVNGTDISDLRTRLRTGQYRLSIRDQNGCATDSTVTISIRPAFLVTLPPDTTVRLGETLTLVPQTDLNPVFIDSVIWNPLPNPALPGQLAQIWEPFENKRYSVTLVDPFGCRATASTLVIVRRDIELYVPNVFTPDHTSHGNDFFTISSGSGVKDLELLRIFDRWGNLAYEWNAPIPPNEWPGWDGTARGQNVAPGVYVYYMRVRLVDGTVYEQKGDVTVVR